MRQKLLRAIPLALALIAPSAFASTCPYPYLCVGDPSNAQLPTGSYNSQALGAQSIAINGKALTNGSITIGGYAGYNGGFDPATSMANAYATAIGTQSAAYGTQSSAFGYLSAAYGDYATALGAQARAGATGGTFAGAIYGTAVGANAAADGNNATAIGANANAQGNGSLAAGSAAQAIGQSNLAILGSATGSDHSIAIGGISSAENANAWGFNAQATAPNSDAIGAGSRATESDTVSFGDPNATTIGSPTVGYYRRLVNVADGTAPHDVTTLNQLMQSTAALGGGASYAGGTFTAPTYSLGSQTFHDVGSALTYLNGQIGTGSGGGAAPVWLASTDTTTPASAQGTDGTSVGAGAQAGNANTSFNVAIGARAQAGTLGAATAGTGGQDTAVGVDSAATAVGAEAFGYQAQATAAFSTAIGNGSLADQSGTVSFGNGTTGIYRRLVNLADGTAPHDAMTVGQGDLVTSIFGGGASLLTDTAPTYTFTSPGAAGSYYDVGSALSALDNGLTAVNTRIDNLPPSGTGPQGPQGPQGPAGTGANVVAGTNIQVTKNAQGDDVVSTTPNATYTTVTTKDAQGNTTVTSGNGVSITSASGSNVSLTTGGLNNGGNVISNVAAGTAPTDAANVSQVQAAETSAVSTSETYTDSQVSSVKSWAQSYTDQQAAEAVRQANAYTDAKFRQLDDRFSRVTAVGSAATAMAANFRGDDSLAAGAGWAGGHSALAVGYRHVMAGGHVSVSFHGAISGSERTLGAGIGYSW